MKAPDESGIKKDFPDKATELIASAGKRCTDAIPLIADRVAYRLEERTGYSSCNSFFYHSLPAIVHRL